jgi:hypothetical protein
MTRTKDQRVKENPYNSVAKKETSRPSNAGPATSFSVFGVIQFNLYSN